MLSFLCADGTVIHIMDNACTALIEHIEEGIVGTFEFDQITAVTGEPPMGLHQGLWVPLVDSTIVALAQLARP